MDYEYFSTRYKLIAIDLRKQTELENSDLKQQINFIGKLEQNVTIFFIIENKEETILSFSQNFVDVSQLIYKNGSSKNYKSFRRVQ